MRAAVAAYRRAPAPNMVMATETRVTRMAADEPEARTAASLLGLELGDEPVPEGEAPPVELGEAELLPGSICHLLVSED
jgi:hypothetical protein